MPSDPAVPAVDPGAAAAAGPAVPDAEGRRCANCAAPLLGDHCYACGQPTKGLVRHFGSILGDFFDSVFELDSRILRTLGPLLFRPGYLSTEYFAGRRVRYVSPVRLFVFLSLITFFAAQLGFDVGDGQPGSGPRIQLGDDDSAQINRATTVAEVETIRDAAVAELAKAREPAAAVPGVAAGLVAAEREIRQQAERRIAAIRAAEAAGTPVTAAPALEDDEAFRFNGTPWHPVDNPVRVSWLPEVAEQQLNDAVGRVKKNLPRIKEDPNLLKDAFLSTVPTTLFVLLPLFALLLKLAYAFRKRLYMEHLIVALHSHAFLCAGLLLVIVFDTLKAWTAGGFASPLFHALEIAVIAWLPIYLLLMQKRVYGQGWIMTLLKYAVLGFCYLFLILWGAVASLMVSLVYV